MCVCTRSSSHTASVTGPDYVKRRSDIGLRRTACWRETWVNTNLALKQIHHIINPDEGSLHDRERERRQEEVKGNEAVNVKTAPNTVAFSSSTRTASVRKGQSSTLTYIKARNERYIYTECPDKYTLKHPAVHLHFNNGCSFHHSSNIHTHTHTPWFY